MHWIMCDDVEAQWMTRGDMVIQQGATWHVKSTLLGGKVGQI